MDAETAASRPRVAAVDDRRAGRAGRAVRDRRLPRVAALPRAAAAAARRARRRCEHFETPLVVALGRARARRARAAPRSSSAATARAPSALRRALRRRCTACSPASTSSTRLYDALHRPAAVLDLRSRLPAARRPRCCSTARCTAWPRSARRTAGVLGRVQTGNLHLYAFLVLVGHRRCARVELAPWLTPRCSTSSCSCRSLGIALLAARARAAATTLVRAARRSA